MAAEALIRFLAKAMNADTVGVPGKASKTGVQLVNPYALPYARWVAEGRGYTVGEATAVAAVAALPTTTAGITLQNGEPQGGKVYVVHSVFAQQEAAPAAFSTFGIAHCVGMNPVAAVVQDIAKTSVKPLLGGAGAYNGNAVIDLGATVVDDLWKPIGPQSQSNLNSAAAGQLDVFIDGLVIIKPGACHSLKGVATSTSVTLRLGWRWFEVEPEELFV